MQENVLATELALLVPVFEDPKQLRHPLVWPLTAAAVNVTSIYPAAQV